MRTLAPFCHRWYMKLSLDHNRYKFIIISFVAFFVVSRVNSVPRQKSPAAAMEDGNIMLGALMMVHERQNEPLICGDVMPQGGVQAVEAMLYTLDWINENRIIPYTKLGARILDDCDKDTYGLQQAVEFIKGTMYFILFVFHCAPNKNFSLLCNEFIGSNWFHLCFVGKS